MQARNVESRIETYIRDNSSGGRTLDISLAKMADQLGCSVASVHRTVQKMESEGLIKIERRRARNRPDKITFLGDSPDRVLNTVVELIEQSEHFNTTIKTLADQLTKSQAEIEELRETLGLYEGRQVIDEVTLNDNILVVFYRK